MSSSGFLSVDNCPIVVFNIIVTIHVFIHKLLRWKIHVSEQHVCMKGDNFVLKYIIETNKSKMQVSRDWASTKPYSHFQSTWPLKSFTNIRYKQQSKIKQQTLHNGVYDMHTVDGRKVHNDLLKPQTCSPICFLWDCVVSMVVFCLYDSFCVDYN